MLYAMLLAFGVTGLSACDNKSKASSQTLVRVNGDEVTIRQLNGELGDLTQEKNGKSPEGARKQVLEALIDRQLLVGEARRGKLDRDPIVVEAIERSKAQILAQAYLQSRVEGLPSPTRTDVEAYFQTHPELFAQRKIYEMNQLTVALSDFSADLSIAMDKAKSLDDVITWLDSHKVAYTRSQAIRNSFELPQQIVSKMQGTEKTQLFVIKDATGCLLLSFTHVKDIPVTLAAATPEIMQFLAGKKEQEAAEDELRHLRVVAKLDYLNQKAVDVSGGNALTAADADHRLLK